MGKRSGAAFGRGRGRGRGLWCGVRLKVHQRMGGGVDFGQMIQRDVGVERGGLQALVAQERLDDAEVGPAPEHVGGAGVAEQVTGTGPLEVGFGEQALDAGGEGAAAKACSLVGEEQSRFCWVILQSRAAFLPVALDPVQRTLTEGHEAIPPAFARADQQGQVAVIHVAEIEIRQLQAADAGGVEGFQDRPIPEALHGLEVGLGKDGFDVFDRQERMGKLPGPFGQDPLGGGVDEEAPFPNQPAEEALERGEQDVLGTPC